MMTEEALSVLEEVLSDGPAGASVLDAPKAKRGRKRSSATEIGENLVREREAREAKRKISRSSEIGDVIEERKARKKINAASKAKVKRALATTVRVPAAKAKRAKLVEKQRKMPVRGSAKGEKTMPRSYQKRDGVAQGTEIAGGARQTVCTFPAKMFAAIAKHAKRDGIAFTEQVRRLCVKGLKG